MNASSEIRALLQQAVRDGVVAGAVATAGDRDGVHFVEAAGQRSTAEPAPMGADTVFWIASLTKAITSVAAMQLVEQGRLALDQPLGDIVSELKAPHVLDGFDADGTPRLRPAARPVTLRHLLTHTSGMGYSFCNEATWKFQQRMGMPDEITCTKAAYQLPLLFDPGERWQYGVGIDWAGYAIECVTGMRLEAYLADHLLGPLGMHDTQFKLRPEQRQRLAAVHVRTEDGGLSPVPFEIPQEPEFYMAGGGLYSTAPDYLRFLRMLLGAGSLEGKRVLQAETVREITRNQVGNLPCGVLQGVRRDYSNDFDFYPGQPVGWGLGFMINLAPSKEGRAAMSQAWAGLINAYYWLDPSRNVAGVLLSQVLPFADARVLDLFRGVETGVYGTLGGTDGVQRSGA